MADLKEIEGNGHNLNIPRYVDTFEEEQPVDLKAVSQKLVELEKEIDTTTSVIAGYCKVLGIKTPF